MLRYCPNCGTEVDETALFCPTCGQAVDQAAETEMPPAPGWPEPDPEPLSPPVAPAWDEPAQQSQPAAPPPPAQPPPAQSPAPPTGEPDAPAPRPRPPGVLASAPVSAPVTLSGWLIGGGAAVGALGALIGLFDGAANPVELLLLIALAGVAATVFAAAALPAIPHLRLVTLGIVLVGFGVGLDRIGLGGSGVGALLLFLGTAAAAIGAIILDLGRDQPLGGA